MEHVIPLDTRERELEKLFDGSKTMLVRGAKEKNRPRGVIQCGDRLYFTLDNGEGKIRAVATVRRVVNSRKLSREESAFMIIQNQHQLQLSKQQIIRWAGQPYLMFVEFENLMEIEPIPLKRGSITPADEWRPVERIQGLIG